MSPAEAPPTTAEEFSPAIHSTPAAADGASELAHMTWAAPAHSSAASALGLQIALEKIAVELAQGVSEDSTASHPPEYPVAVPLLMSTSSSGEASPCEHTIGTLRACKGCQKAKTACSPEQRPCLRCVRLKVDCDSDQPPVKTACTNCRRAKVKCLFDANANCIRCCRLGIECSPHVPGKRKRTEPAERAAERAAAVRERIVPPQAPISTLFLDQFNKPPMLHALLPTLAQECEVRDARLALEALQRQGGIAINSQTAENLFSQDGALSPPGSSPGALSAVMTLLMVREGLPWNQPPPDGQVWQPQQQYIPSPQPLPPRNALYMTTE